MYGSCTVLSGVQFDDGIPVRYPAIFRYAILGTGSTARESKREGCVLGTAVNARLCAGDDWIGACKAGAYEREFGAPRLSCPMSMLPTGLAEDLQRPFFYKSGVLCSMALHVQFIDKCP